MKPRAFNYVRVGSLDQAFEAYASVRGAGCYLAGGQSLVPALSLRFQSPELLIDISNIAALRGISLDGDFLRIGALVRHAEILRSHDIATHAPLLSLAAPYVAHPAIRNCGTIGGSIALADPAAEFPAMALALDAEFELANASGLRRVRADGFFRGLYETALQPGEILTAILIPSFGINERCAFDELSRRRGDYALVGAGVQATVSRDRVDEIRIAFLSVGATPIRARCAEAAVKGRVISAGSIAAAQAALDQDLDPDEDRETSPAMRIHLARVLLGRLLGRIGDPHGPSGRGGA
ncbi:MAG: xanthine dehydrogenase family protein subunit M [Pseudorhodoplanes sp.]|uniref:FAD binding domain-containing protein n=1 Tax=Pseudorhodoplanes sp. TaxID=1934341 RepID=UPI003D14BD5B